MEICFPGYICCISKFFEVIPTVHHYISLNYARSLIIFFANNYLFVKKTHLHVGVFQHCVDDITHLGDNSTTFLSHHPAEILQAHERFSCKNKAHNDQERKSR